MGLSLSAEWQFGEPLSIAQLDPSELVDTPTQQGELVADSIELDELPVIPEIGSCDGLPNAAPQSGPGTTDSHPDPESALAAFYTVIDLRQGADGWTVAGCRESAC